MGDVPKGNSCTWTFSGGYWTPTCQCQDGYWCGHDPNYVSTQEPLEDANGHAIKLTNLQMQARITRYNGDSPPHEPAPLPLNPQNGNVVTLPCVPIP